MASEEHLWEEAPPCNVTPSSFWATDVGVVGCDGLSLGLPGLFNLDVKNILSTIYIKKHEAIMHNLFQNLYIIFI